MTDGRWGRWAALAVTVLLVAVFAFLNGRERTSLHLGFAILYQVPLVAVVLLSFLLGMVTMFLFGLSHDLRVRRRLREQSWPEHRPVEPQPPPPDPLP